ncbi:Ribosomal RNA small subunit methyltransferase NEP1 [Euphorbia peplus]|nr:Ribosomal RNA small subunit methyltransferase NEP1 [Euphorbia peplus]
MVRLHGMKGPKRKKREERYHKEEEEDEQLNEEQENEEQQEEPAFEMQGLPVVPSDPNAKKPGVVFVLEKASLEVAKVGKTYQILNSDDHSNFLRKHKKDPADYRPDIVFQALLSILDSPINKAGRLRAVYVKTDKGVLFEVKPHVRIPRTYKRFAGVMLQLLQKLSISATGKREKLLRVIKNPVTQYLPVNSHKIGFSFSSEKLVKMNKYVTTVGDDKDLVFVVGAMSHGKIDCDYIDDFIAISGYPMSAGWCVARICEALADKWDVL